MPFVDTPGLRVHYLQAGTGDTPVVFLHGFPQTSYQWRHQMHHLSEAGYACFAPDNRGFGATDKPDTRISRALLARDVVRFMDAVGLESAHIVSHDWGGIIGFKVVADYPERVRSIALIDTLCTVWHPRAQHGYWFKAPGLAEAFYAEHHAAFIEVLFAGRDGSDLPAAPASPWRVPGGTRPRPTWIDQDALDHYRTAFADPASHAAAIQYYRYGLPFHWIDEDGATVHALDEAAVAAMWLHPAGLPEHPRYVHYMDYGPEDRATRFPRPALWLYGHYLGRGGSATTTSARTGPPTGNPFVDQFSSYFPQLTAHSVAAGHFLGEEAAPYVNETLAGFLGGQP